MRHPTIALLLWLLRVWSGASLTLGVYREGQLGKGLGRVRGLWPEAGVERSWNSGVAEAVTGGLAADLPSGGEAVQQLADGGSRGHQAIVSIDFDLNCQSVSQLSACVYSTQS